MKKILLICILCFNLLSATEQSKNFEDISLNIETTIQSACSINHFIIVDEIFFLGVGSIFDDSTLESTACIVKYNMKTKTLIENRSFLNIDSFYKILNYKNHYFLLGARELSKEENSGKSYADKGFTGILVKLNNDETVQKQIEIHLNGFGNVKDLQIEDDQIIILSAIKNSTIYDNDLYATVCIKKFDTNLLVLDNLQLKTIDYLADNFYVEKDTYILIDRYHDKICPFNKDGSIETCFDFNDNKNEIVKIEKMKNFYSKYHHISAFDSTFHYALKKEMKYEPTLDQSINIQYLYKLER